MYKVRSKVQVREDKIKMILILLLPVMKRFIFLFFIIIFQIKAVAQDSSAVFTIDYQKSKSEWTQKYLLLQIPSVRCEGETIFFTGAIDHSSVRRLFKLVNMKYPVARSEIVNILSEVGVNYHTDMPANPKCDDDDIFEKNHYFYILKDLKKKKQDPALAPTCQPKKLVISSPGGELRAALQLYYFIRKHSLSVEIPDYGICMSACTRIRHFSESFSAGPNSLFMFHRPHVMGHTITHRIFRVCLTYKQFIENQILEAFWQLEDLFPEQVIEGINQFEDFYVPYHVLETWNY